MKKALIKKLSILFAFLLLSLSPANLHTRASTPNLPIIPLCSGTEDDDFPSPRDRIMRGQTESSSSSWANWFYEIADYVTQTVRNSIFNSVYPVGTIYMTVTEVNPHELFGGTWIPWGSGRVPIGVNTANPDFNSIERLGGSASHTHTLDSAAAMIGSDLCQTNTLAFAARNVGDLFGTTYTLTAPNKEKAAQRSHNTALTGTTDSSGNLPPYITCYMWKRVA